MVKMISAEPSTDQRDHGCGENQSQNAMNRKYTTAWY